MLRYREIFSFSGVSFSPLFLPNRQRRFTPAYSIVIESFAGNYRYIRIKLSNLDGRVFYAVVYHFYRGLMNTPFGL